MAGCYWVLSHPPCPHTPTKRAPLQANLGYFKLKHIYVTQIWQLILLRNLRDRHTLMVFFEAGWFPGTFESDFMLFYMHGQVLYYRCFTKSTWDACERKGYDTSIHFLFDLSWMLTNFSHQFGVHWWLCYYFCHAVWAFLQRQLGGMSMKCDFIFFLYGLCENLSSWMRNTHRGDAASPHGHAGIPPRCPAGVYFSGSTLYPQVILSSGIG